MPAPLDLSPLQGVGLRFAEEPGEAWPDTGMEVAGDGIPAEVRFVRAASPAEAAGLSPGDRLLALDGFELGRGGLTDRLRWYAPGDAVTVQFFRDGVLSERRLLLGEPRPQKPRLVARDGVSTEEKAAFAAWMGQPYPF
jgi:predicted metalloprotease with PDZ domain